MQLRLADEGVEGLLGVEDNDGAVVADGNGVDIAKHVQALDSLLGMQVVGTYDGPREVAVPTV